MTSTTVDRRTVVRVELFDADLQPLSGRRFGYTGTYSEREVRGFDREAYAGLVAAATHQVYAATHFANLGDVAHIQPDTLPGLTYVEMTAIVHQDADYAEAYRITKLFRLLPVRTASGRLAATYRLVEE